MRDYLPYVVIGLGAGSVYAIAAMGLVVTYKTSGIFNFAHGAVGMAATFAFYSLRVDAGWPTWLAAAVAILGVAPAMGVAIDRLLLRRLVGAPSSTYVVVSLGLLVALQGLFLIIYGPATRRVEPFFPRSTFRLPGVNVGWDQALLVVIAAVSGLGLALFFRTRFGILTRAVVDDRDLSELTRVNAGGVTTASWIIGCAFAALSGVLLSPLLGVDAVILTLLVIQAFGAAAVGRLVSLPLTYAGALGIGVAASLSTKFVVDHPSLAGVPSSLPFVVLFAVLVFSRKGRFAELTRTDLRAGASVGVVAARFPTGLLVALAVLGASLPGRLDSARLLTATAVVAFVLIFSSLGLLVGMSRQVSLCHVVFVALGATTLARLRDAGVPYLPALLLAGLILVPVGAVVAIPAIRLSGLFLALATFGFGVLAQNLVYQTKAGFGGKAILTINRPEILGVSLRGDKAYYVFVLLVVAAGLVAIELVRVTRLGRILRALADSPLATQSLGINPVVPRVLVFCFTAFLAAVAGGLLGTLTLSVNAQTFDFFQSLVWVTALVTAGPASLGGAVTAAILLVWVPAVFTSRTVVEWQPVAFGVAAIFFAQARNGLVGLIRRPDFSRLAEKTSWRLGSVRLSERLEEAALMALLEVRGLRSGYGRAETIRSVDLVVPSAATVVLLGPNGAGKTTLLKTIAGLVGATGGEVRFQGRAVTRTAAHTRARRGICLIPEGRGIFRRLSVRENLVVQADPGAARAAVERAAGLFPVLGQRLDQQAATLSGGEQQMLALARAFVTDAPLILADELSMGLAPVIVDQIFDAFGVLRREGRSVLLVEQYVERAVGVADYVYILNKGRVVFTGLPAECSSSAVFARYLQGAASP